MGIEIDILLGEKSDFSLDYDYDITMQEEENKNIDFTIYENGELVDVSAVNLSDATFYITNTEYTATKVILDASFDKTEGANGELSMLIETDIDPGEYFGELVLTFDSGIIDKSKLLRMYIEKSL